MPDPQMIRIQKDCTHKIFTNTPIKIILTNNRSKAKHSAFINKKVLTKTLLAQIPPRQIALSRQHIALITE
ncbi:hypothetical protein AO703_08445 [[Enterobacter] lignolyticus]|uniref:Uncharacterized protein n=1 Tax=[Enterobacter] lignolyticus TaxID=1334193 RepID=A0A806X9N3_9ENTR|nr:hypothetical protein AO703_08445 [[Enterobacter] lignolyticus]